jgi:glutathione S-transferase
MPFHPTLITLLTCAFLWGLAFSVGRARHKFGVTPPETRGDPRFEAVFRTQQNTIESTVMFLPLLWILSGQGQGTAAAVLGWSWLLARVFYALGYTSSAPSRRLIPFVVSVLCIMISFLLGLWSLWQGDAA